MDSTKLKQFLLLRELEQQEIAINHEKLRTLDSERAPKIIFESGGPRSEKELVRRGSSTASSDSGFPISPSPPPSANSRVSKSDAPVFPQSSYVNVVEERSDDEFDVPPLPPSLPPEVIQRSFSPDVLHTLHSIDNNSSSPVKINQGIDTANNDTSEPYSLLTDSSDTSTCDSSDESDSCGHYVVTDETSHQMGKHLLPFEISKLEGSVKSMRSKIRPGTVQNITTMFTNKARRIKKENKRKKPKLFVQNTRNEKHYSDNTLENDVEVLDKKDDCENEDVDRASASDSSNSESDHEFQTDDPIQKSNNSRSESSQSDTEPVSCFAFSAQSLEPNKKSTKKSKLPVEDTSVDIKSSESVQTSCERVQTSSERVQTSSERVQTNPERVQTSFERLQASSEEDHSNSERVQRSSERVQTNSESPGKCTDSKSHIDRRNENKQTSSEVILSFVSDNEGNVGVHQSVCGSEKVNGETLKDQVETRTSTAPSSTEYVLDINVSANNYNCETDDFVQKSAPCNMIQKSENEANTQNVSIEIPDPHICIDSAPDTEVTVNEMLSVKSETSTNLFLHSNNSHLNDLENESYKVNDNEPNTNSENSKGVTHGHVELHETRKDGFPGVTAGRVEDGILELQRAVERNNALLNQTLEKNWKLLESFPDDEHHDSNGDENVKSTDKECLIPTVISCQGDVSEKQSETAETRGVYRSVINLEGENYRQQPEGTISQGKEESVTRSHEEIDNSVQLEINSNPATCGDATDLSISDDSQCVLSNCDRSESESESTDKDMKSNTSLNDFSASGDLSFSSNSTNTDRPHSPDVQVLPHHTDQERGKYTDSAKTIPQTADPEKSFIDSSDSKTEIVKETLPHRSYVRIIHHEVNPGGETDKAKVIQQECKTAENKLYKSKTLSFVNCNPSEKECSEAYLARGTEHVTEVTANVSTYTTPCDHVSNSNTHPRGEQQNLGVPEFYTLPGTFETDKIVSLKELSGIARSMPDRYSGYTSSGSESSSYTGGRKVRTKTTTLRSGKGDDRSEQNLDMESNVHLKHLAETISKLNGENSDELLPEINQTVTKLPGGNLVITTLTHKIVEEEDDEKEVSRPPQIGEDDRRCIVQDHKGNYYMVEDITDESQESAYYSTSSDSHNTSDGYGHSGQNFQGIYNLQAVGKSGIDYNTAEEVLLGLYNPAGSIQIQEIDERTGEGHYLREHYHSGGQYGTMSSDSSYNKQMTSYDETDKVHRPIPQTMGSSSVKTVKHSYEMEREEGEREGYRKLEAMQSSQSHADNTGMSASNSSYMMEASAMYPPVVLPPVVPPPPVVPVYHMAVVDVTPSPPQTVAIKEEKEEKIEIKAKDVERPIYKSVALVKGPYEAPKWQKQRKEFIPAQIEDKKCVVLNSRATEDRREETVEEVTTKEYYTMKMSSGGVTEDDFNNRSSMETHAPHRFKTEKVFKINGTAPSPVNDRHFTSKFNVINEDRPAHIPTESSQTFATKHQVRNDFERHHDGYQSHTDGYQSRADGYQFHADGYPSRTDGYQSRADGYQSHADGYQSHADGYQSRADGYQTHSDGDKDMRIIRGNILIKNTLDQNLDEYNDNINLFDHAFNMTKENPLYHSDEDIYKRYEREREQERAHNQRIQNSINNDITFETVDRFTKSKEVKRQPRPKKNFSELLLSKLATIDSKDIRQHIDVKHHHEDIYGDLNLIHADGSRAGQSGTSNFDSVAENVDLMLKNGKAFITVTVTAERITPIDIEFNVWRKNQAIVTRVIEIDLFANEQRRRLYETVMQKAHTQRTGNGGYTYVNPRETVLSSDETLDLFTEIMDTADGEGDQEDITVRKSQKKTRIPGNNLDFLY